MLKKLFGFDPSQTTIRKEILAGVTTFLTMSYILAVNPAMFKLLPGMPEGAVFTSTALAAIIGCLAMAFWGKLPFGLAPGMGLNAFFVFSVCLGPLHATWQFALTAVLIEGFIFILLTLTNVREAIVNAIPLSLRNAIGAGIGLFIAFIGLQSAGVVVKDGATLVALGDITSGSALLAIIGVVITGFMYIRNVPGAILVGILVTMIIGVPMGVTEFRGIVSQPESIAPIFCQFEFDRVFTLDMLVVVFTFLFIDMFDTVGTLVGVCTKANMVDEKGKIYRIKQAFMADAIATTAGAMLGTSTTTTYVESAAGVAQGGRSGLTAFAVAICFAIALLFSPLFLSIPSAATAPALIIVGLMMLEPVVKIPFNKFDEAIPAFICIVAMPLTYSISNGILLGLITYVVLNVLCGNFKKITPTMYILAVLFVLKFVFMNPNDERFKSKPEPVTIACTECGHQIVITEKTENGETALEYSCSCGGTMTTPTNETNEGDKTEAQNEGETDNQVVNDTTDNPAPSNN
jgi:AGZA family xanthine/uracil permease-like MFS transporter